MKLKPSLQLSYSAPGIKAMLVGAMLLTVGTTAALIYVPWSLISKRNIDTMVGQVNQEIAVGTSQEVERLFNNAQSAQQLLRSSFSQDLASLSDPKGREFFFLRVLQANPDFTWVQYGDANGDFWGAQRTPEGQLHFHLRDWDPNTKTTQSTIHTYRVQGESLQRQESSTQQMNPPFYAPDRPWYKSAVAQPSKRTWTVYVYRSTNTPGMDATVTLEQDRKVLGVLGVGIELKQLSEYLQRLKGNHSGEAFIINANRELIASTDVGEVTPNQLPQAGGLRLKQFSETTNPLLQYASQMLENRSGTGDQGSGTALRSQVSAKARNPWQRYIYKDPQTGERYYITLTPLDHLDWSVGTVIPEANYLVEINRNKQVLLVVISFFTVLTAGGAILLANRLIAHPVLGIAQAAADIEAERFDLSRLSLIGQRQDEIGQLARVFEQMAHKVYAREQQLKQQVRELRIEVDEARRSRHVQEIVDTDFFQSLAAKAQVLRKRDKMREETLADSESSQGNPSDLA